MSPSFIDAIPAASPLRHVIARWRAFACLVLALVLSAGAGVSPCAAQDGGGSEVVSGSEAIEALAQAMRARGLTPPPESDLSLEDHIENRTVTNAEGRATRHVGFRIGPDGHVIPSGKWQDFRPNYCKRQARYMRAPARVMDFEIIRNTERANGKTRNQLWVFARLSDAGTGIMINASEGEASNITSEQLASEGYAADALEAAFAKMERQPQAPDDPCGEVRLKHVSGQKVGEPFVFRAGFSGFGKALVYTWDFGDGSAPAEGRSLQRPQHVYDAEGTYEVSVRVRQMNGQTHTGTISVEVGGSLTLFFSSRIEQRAKSSSETLLAYRYEAEVPLTPSDGSNTHEGTAPLRNVEYISHMMKTLEQAGCTVQLRDGVLAARVVFPEGASARPVEVLLGPPSREATPTADLACPFPVPAARSINPRMWWGHFIVMHQDEAANENFRITGWERTADPDVVARKVYSRSRTVPRTRGRGSIIEETTIEIRRE